MRISTSEAQIKTAQVEIKALTVGGKQVTAGLFRQLPEAPLIDTQTGLLNGVPWGLVNYHPDKCADRGAHLHIVWQKGRELFRDAIYQKQPTGLYEYDEAIYDQAVVFVSCRVRDGWQPEDRLEMYQKQLNLRVADERVQVYLSDDVKRVLRYPEDADEARANLRNQYGAMSSDEAWNALVQKVRRKQRYRDRWKTTYESLSSYEQLFLSA